jgi:hypothetical protein
MAKRKKPLIIRLQQQAAFYACEDLCDHELDPPEMTWDELHELSALLSEAADRLAKPNGK